MTPFLAEDWIAVKDVIRRFEYAWGQAAHPVIDDYLPASDPSRSRAVVELVHIELELRLKAGQTARAEEYLARYPGLAADRAAALELIATEYELRRRREPGLALDEYLKRFPQYRAELPEHIAQSTIDDRESPLRPTELRAEATPQITGYEIQCLLGRGGMGLVYQARDIRLNRMVALKTIIGGAFTAPSERERFRREAEAIAHLDHPNIVPVYEVGEAAGVPYFSMKYYTGGSLAKYKFEPSSDARTIARLVESTARAIHHAHQRGVLHRDLKPSNVLLDEDGRPHVADFGLAKRFDPEAGLLDVSTVAGTPAYMAPEQASGRGELTTASDVYGLGVILYEMLCGAPPFDGNSPLVVLRQLAEQSPPKLTIRNPRVPRDLETIALKCLEKDPRRRYESAQELADDLARWQADKPIVARPVPPWEWAWRWIRRHPVIAGLSALSSAALALFVVTLVVSKQRIIRALTDEHEARTELSAALNREQELLYFERIGSAYRLWSSNQTERAEQLLDLCPAHLRHWEWNYLDRLRKSGCVKLTEHTIELFCVAASVDGRRFATADRDGCVRLWDAQSHTTIRTWNLSERVLRLAFSPDGAHLAAAQQDVVTVLPIDGRESHRFEGGRCVAFHPDGSRLAIAHNESFAIYEWPTGRQLHTLTGHAKLAWACAFNPKGDRLATTGGDSTVRIWDVESGKPVGEPRQFPQLVYSLHYFSDGRLLVSQHNESRILDSESWSELARVPAGAHGADRLAISADDRLLASPARDGTIKIWNLKSNEEELVFRGHPPYINGLVFSGDSRHLTSVGHDSIIRIWNLKTRTESRVFSRARVLGGLAFTSDGRRLAIALASSGSHASEKGRVQILDVESGRELLRLDALGSPRFSPDDRWLATNRADGSVSLWDSTSGREMRKLTVEGHRSMRIALSPDGRWLACGTDAGKILIWDLSHDAQPRILSGHTNLVSWLVFSPNGRKLASCDRHGKVSIWDYEWNEVNQWQLDHALQVMAFSPDGQRLAMAGESSTIDIRNVTTGEELHRLHGHADWVTGISFSPDGTRLVSGSTDETLKLWDVASGEEVLSLTGLRGMVVNVAVDPAGRRIVACESVVRMWEID
jgi:eukaryotic-like serine/threonine-protein kinase